MKARRVVPMLSRDEKRLVGLYRRSNWLAKGMIIRHAAVLADESTRQHMPPPGNVLAFRTEAAGRAAASCVAKDKGEASPSRPDAS